MNLQVTIAKNAESMQVLPIREEDRMAEALSQAERAYDQVVEWLEHFEDLEDPRQLGKVAYPLDEMLLQCPAINRVHLLPKERAAISTPVTSTWCNSLENCR